MSETLTSTPSGRRAAATWVTATGVMLLLAAATLFVAVRWDEIPDGAKLVALGVVTIAALLGGRAMRRTLPATGDVVFHLGALLIPVDLAAAGIRSGGGWPALLLVEGLVSAIVFAALAAGTGSITLRLAAWASVPVAAAGVAACTPLPAALVLATFALGAYAVAVGSGRAPRVRDAARAWAMLAATGPVLATAAALLAGADGFRIGLGTLTALGLSGHAFAVAALPAGVASAVVLGAEADRRRDLRLAFATFVAIAVGGGTALTGSGVGSGVGFVAVAGAFATLELAAVMLVTDRFWNEPLRRVASIAEAAACLPMVLAAIFVAITPLLPDGPWPLSHSFTGDRGMAAAAALLALGWLAADVRLVRANGRSLLRSLARGSGRRDTTALVTTALASAVVVGTGSSRGVAVTLVVLSAVAILLRRAGGRSLAAVSLPFAVVCAGGSPLAAAALAIGGACALVLGVRPADDSTRARLLASSTSLALLLGGAFGSTMLDGTAAIAVATSATTGALWLLAGALDERRPGTGVVARFAAVLPVYIAVAALGPRAMIGPLAVATVLAMVDAVLGSRPRLLLAPALLVQLLLYDIAMTMGWSRAAIGLALCVSAVAWSATTAFVPRAWREGPAAAGVLAFLVGLDLAAARPAALASAMMILGAVVLCGGLYRRHPGIAHLGAAVMTVGLFGHLALAGLVAAEWYLTPVGVQLLVAGWQVRRRDGVSSWVAYAPPIVFLGGSALVERTAGGPASHALYCGAVGVLAVAVGGWRRLSAPLVVGTGLLVAVSVHESLSSLAGIATWMWFAAGGLALVAVGVALEWADQGPVEAGRRLAEVLGERFG